MNTTKLSGLSVAVAAAALFLGAPMAHAAESGSAKVGHCVGANACKGHGACKSASNACKGQNACKGHGFTESTAETCKTAGGKFEAPKPQKKAADAKKANS